MGNHAREPGRGVIGNRASPDFHKDGTMSDFTKWYEGYENVIKGIEIAPKGKRRCNRCGYRWRPHVEHPKRCPRCKSKLWATPRAYRLKARPEIQPTRKRGESCQ